MINWNQYNKKLVRRGVLELLTKLATKNELDENQIREIENMKKQL